MLFKEVPWRINCFNEWLNLIKLDKDLINSLFNSLFVKSKISRFLKFSSGIGIDLIEQFLILNIYNF